MDNLKFLNDYSGIIAMITVIVTIIFGVATVWTSSIRKKLTYQLISLNKIIKLKGVNMDKKLKVIYGDREIDNPILIEIKMQNLGNKPIIEKNFRGDLVVDFCEKLEILETECIFEESKQYKIKEKYTGNNKKIVLPEFLLNAKKSMRLKIVANSIQPVKEDDINIDAYIEGTKLEKIRSFEDGKKSQTKIYYIVNLIPIVLITLFLTFIWINTNYNRGENIAFISFFFFLIFAPISSMMNIEFIRKERKN